MPKVSIIIPCYNVEKYIKRALDSALSQSYQDVEIVVVDDGSCDQSGAICDAYAACDPRIVVVHKPNAGLASARNVGLKNASGSYVLFLDSDDWLREDTVEFCLRQIETCPDTDIVQFDVIKTAVFETEKNIHSLQEILQGKDALWHLMYYSTKSDLYFSVCRCMFAKSLFDDVSFPEGKINEDIAVKYKLFAKARKIVQTNEKLYYYFQDEGSITTAGLKKRDFDLYDAARELLSLTAQEKYKKIDELGRVKYARTSLSLLCKISYYGWDDDSIDRKKTVKDLQKQLRSDFWLLLRSPMPFSRKALTILYSISFRMTNTLIRLIKSLRLC